MESINTLRELIIKMLKEITQLNDAFTELDSLIDKEAECIHRQERIAKINVLKSRLVYEVQRIQDEEYESERSFNTGKLRSGIAHFVLGSIAGAMTKQENPFSFGYNSFSTELDKKACFGNVMIFVKKNGNLEDVEAVSISSFAREHKTTESNVILVIKDNGYILLTPEEFWELLLQLKEEIMEGRYKSEIEQVKALLDYV